MGYQFTFPLFPAIPLHTIPIGFIFTNLPCSVLSDMTVDFYPSVIGLKNLVVLMLPHMAYMMERDVVLLPYTMNAMRVASKTGLSDRQFPVGSVGRNLRSLPC